ncbi:unnamed protein product [Cylicocyclus nassatus]|uniref:Zinc metalloproteinase n=1 Tax=Cylicocyclus nassatus TaxID=53992 RepID=A0AA36GI31_CYLNA|nr:unnamed protein product [Cylicocyclus nassatus]
MRVTLFLLLFAGSNAASNIVEKIDKALSDLPTTLNKAELLANYERIHAHEEETENELRLSPQQQETVQYLEAEAAALHRNEQLESEGMHTSIEDINMQSPLGELLYQSDIVLSTEQAEDIAAAGEKNQTSRTKRQSMNFKVHPKSKWPDNTVFYSYNIRLEPETREVFQKAAMEWQSQSCIKFVENPSVENRVLLVEEGGCFSNVGHLGRVQKLSLGMGCDTIGIAAHELGHIMGMWHTQSRTDRDDYVFIDTTKVHKTYMSEFKIYEPDMSELYDVPYDYGSIMHYSARSFVYDKRNKSHYTVVPHDIRYTDTLGSHIISFYDIFHLNRMYDCLDKCKGKQRSSGKTRVKRQMGRYFMGSGSSIGGRTSSISRGSIIGGSSGRRPGAEGGSNGAAGIAGIRGGGELPGLHGDTRLPGERGSSTGGKTAWWNLPSVIGGMLPDWIFNIGANWDWDYTVLPPTTTTTTSRPATTTSRPKTTTRPPSTTTTRPITTSTKPRVSTTTTTTTTPTTTTTTAPVAPGPSGPRVEPVYERGNCENGGYPNPKDCSKCVCPSGYGGRLCNERPAGAGKVLQANSNVQILKDTIGYKDVNGLYFSKKDFKWAHYWIQAPQGRKVEITVGDFSNALKKDLNEDGGCTFAGVEIKTQKDQRLTGYRYCSPSFAGQVFVSESNLVPVMVYSRTFEITAILQYRMI